MFKIGEIKMSELAGTAFPELAGREGLLYGVSDPEAPGEQQHDLREDRGCRQLYESA